MAVQIGNIESDGRNLAGVLVGDIDASLGRERTGRDYSR